MTRQRLNGEDLRQWADTHTVSFVNGCYAWCKDGAVLAGETRTWPRTTTQPPNSLYDSVSIGSAKPIPPHPLAIAAPNPESTSEILEIEDVAAFLPTAVLLDIHRASTSCWTAEGGRARKDRSREGWDG